MQVEVSKDETPMPGDGEAQGSLQMPGSGSAGENTDVVTGGDNHKKTSTKRSIGRKGRILLIAALALIFGLGAAGLAYSRTKGAQRTSNSSQTAQPTTTAQPTGSSLPAKTLSLSGNSYLESLRRLGDLGMFKNPESYFGESCKGQNDCEPSVTAADIRYYQIGTTKEGGEINIVAYPGGMGDSFYVFTGKKGAYRVLVDDANALKGALQDGFTADSSAVITDFTLPKAATLGGSEFVQTGYSQPLFEGLDSMGGAINPNTSDRKKMKSEGVYDYYRVVEKDEANFSIIGTYAAINAVWGGAYRPNFMGLQSEASQPVAWSVGDNNKSHYFSGGMGCGTTGYVIAKNVSKDDVKQVGLLDGKPVYQLPTSHALVQELYTKDYDATSEYFEDKTLAKLTIQQFSDKHAYVLAENGAGEYVVLQRDDVFIRGGCAKPVVYLYPTKPVVANVSVGANVVESIPTYESNGWQGVLAKPDGTLLYRNGVYRSLFWDGYGHGSYPAITTGSVVPTTVAADTIRVQLAQQGLRQQEIEDFMAYWQPKLPSKPYTRISWLSKSQVDGLAPLHVSPVPDTVIRVFVDFEGLDTPVKMDAQQFVQQPRRGFTVVEWGGLARSGL